MLAVNCIFQIKIDYKFFVYLKQLEYTVMPWLSTEYHHAQKTIVSNMETKCKYTRGRVRQCQSREDDAFRASELQDHRSSTKSDTKGITIL